MGEGVEERVVIVTGAGHGIGLSIARHLASHGASVVVGEYLEDRLDHVMGELEALGPPSLGRLCDVRVRSDLDQLVAATVAQFGRVDALVSNAYTYAGPKRLAELGDEDLEDIYNSGVKAALWGMQAVYPHMKAAGWGRIVNVGSAAGILGLEGFGAYSAAKEAVRALTRTAAREWASDGIVANSYCPAAIGDRSPANEFAKQGFDKFWFQHPMGPHGSLGDDIAPVVAFLCSDACRYVNGQNLMVDGGAYLWS